MYHFYCCYTLLLWQRLHIKTIVSKTKLFCIEELDVKFDNSSQRKYEIISGTGQGVVMIIPILNSNFVFISEYSAGINDYSLSFPKGKIDEGESVLEAANRELQEEIGYKSTTLEQIYTIDLAPGYMNHKTHVVVADNGQNLYFGDENPEPLIKIVCPIEDAKLSKLFSEYVYRFKSFLVIIYIF